MTAAAAGTLPAVSFVKPDGIDDEHPTTPTSSPASCTLRVIDAVRNGPAWADTAIIVTYDENGGFWDHVAPPAGDRWGPGAGSRPWSSHRWRGGLRRHHRVRHVVDLALIERRFDLAPLGTRDAVAADMTAAFDLYQP